VSFASPCCVPLVPGYLAYLAGLVGADTPAIAPEDARAAAAGHTGRCRVVGAALLFVAGFTDVFTAGWSPPSESPTRSSTRPSGSSASAG